MVENKLLYGMRLAQDIPAGFALEYSSELFPSVRLRPAVPADLTIVCYGGLLPDVESAAGRLFDQHEVVAEIICPTQFLR